MSLALYVCCACGTLYARLKTISFNNQRPYTTPPIVYLQFAEWYIVSREFVLKHTSGSIDMLYTTEAAANML